MDKHARPSQPDLLWLVADGLTLIRILLAGALFMALRARQAPLGSAILGTAWLTDFFDGRAARASTGASRLGPLDLWADTLVGAAAVVGFVAWGWVPAVVGLSLVVVLFASFALTRNEALSMILQATGYALVLWRTWRDGATVSLAWLIAIIAAIAVLNRRVLLERSLPTFFGGVADLLRGRASPWSR